MTQTPVEPTPPRDRPSPRGVGRWTMLVFVGGAAPIAFALEVLLRSLLLPASFERARADLRPTLTPVAWVLLAVCVPAVLLGWSTNRWLVRRELARLRDPSPTQRRRVQLEALLLATSIPQLPALLAIVASMFGAENTPVLLTLAVSTAGVVAQGLRSRC
jgi:hypothetical protein